MDKVKRVIHEQAAKLVQSTEEAAARQNERDAEMEAERIRNFQNKTTYSTVPATTTSVPQAAQAQQERYVSETQSAGVTPITEVVNTDVDRPAGVSQPYRTEGVEQYRSTSNTSQQGSDSYTAIPLEQQQQQTGYAQTTTPMEGRIQDVHGYNQGQPLGNTQGVSQGTGYSQEGVARVNPGYTGGHPTAN